MEVTYRRAEVGNVGALLRVSAACAGAPQWSEAAWVEAVGGLGRARAVWLAERAGECVGFAVAACAGETAELESIAVAEAERRRGVGRALCGSVMQWAAEQGARRLELEVRASSDAVGLYVALGFVEQGRRRGYYRGPVEDAVLMARVVSKE